MIEQVRMQLHNYEAEREVLGCLITHGDLMARWQEVLSEEMFFHPKHRILYKAIATIFESGNTPDLLDVSMHFMSHPIEGAPEAWEIAEISSSVATSVNFDQHVSLLGDLAKRRKYWMLGQKLMAVGTDLTVNIDTVDSDIDKVREDNLQRSKDVYDMKAANAALTERISRNYNGDTSTMLPTGARYIDERGGLQLTDFVVIGGSTSMGKSTLAVNYAVNFAKQKIPTMFFTLEMTIEQLAARINSPLSGVPSNIMLYKKLRSDQIHDLERATASSNALPFYIDDSSTNYEKIKESIRSNAIKRGVKAFFIDYLQVLSSTRKKQESEAQFYETVSRELKNLAKELKVCIVALAQLNRDVKDADPRPTLSKIKASSGIEQAADTVILIYRPDYYGKKHRYHPDLDPATTAEIIIAKGRNIGTGSFYAGFRKDLSVFYDLDTSSESDQPQQSQPTVSQSELPF